LPDPWYDADYQVARVRSDGAMRWQGEMIYVSEALAGELLGLAEIDCDRWLVRFADVELGTIDRTAPRTLRRAGAQALRSQSRSRPSTDRKTVTHLSGPNCHL
jgi:hypothetical protein